MNILNLNSMDLIGLITGFIFTIMVLSYLFGDNPLFRFAMYVFIGVSAGYVVIVTISNVILPQMIYPLMQGTTSIMTILLWIGAFFLVFKAFPNVSKIGNGIMAFLVGVGAAAAIGGAVLGTILPQLLGTMNIFETGEIPGDAMQKWGVLLNGFIVLIATLTTLLYFQFHEGNSDNQNVYQWQKQLNLVKSIGQVFIAMTLGVLFVGVYVASISAFVERLDFVWQFLVGIISPILGS